MVFKDDSNINWRVKQDNNCTTCGCPLRPDTYKCATARDMPALRCIKCNRLVQYSPIAYFIRVNKSKLKYKNKYDINYDELVLEVLKEEGM